MASGGYPGDFQIGKDIQGLEAAKGRQDAFVFHAGTKKDRNRFVTWGGRVLNVVGTGSDLESALKRVYDTVGAIQYDGMFYRKDIGFRALKAGVKPQADVERG
jgi:phosphoribosylamine--glycine ligase